MSWDPLRKLFSSQSLTSPCYLSGEGQQFYVRFNRVLDWKTGILMSLIVSLESLTVYFKTFITKTLEFVYQFFEDQKSIDLPLSFSLDFYSWTLKNKDLRVLSIFLEASAVYCKTYKGRKLWKLIVANIWILEVHAEF